MTTGRTLYSILQVTEDASIEVIKGAYKHLAQKYHPDKNTMNRQQCEDMMRLLNKAYMILSDQDKRKVYDSALSREREEMKKEEEERQAQERTRQEHYSRQREEEKIRKDFEEKLRKEYEENERKHRDEEARKQQQEEHRKAFEERQKKEQEETLKHKYEETLRRSGGSVTR